MWVTGVTRPTIPAQCGRRESRTDSSSGPAFDASDQVGAMRLPSLLLIVIGCVRGSVLGRNLGTSVNVLGAKPVTAEEFLRAEAAEASTIERLSVPLLVPPPPSYLVTRASLHSPKSSPESATQDAVPDAGRSESRVSASASSARPSSSVLRRQIQHLLSQLLRAHLARLAELRRQYAERFSNTSSSRNPRAAPGPNSSGGAVMYLPVGGSGGGKRCPTAADAAASSISQMAFLSLLLAIFNVVVNISNNINNNNNNNNNNNDNNVSSSNTNLSSNNNNANQINIQLPPPVIGRRRRSSEELRQDAKRMAARTVMNLLSGVASSRRASFLCAVSDTLCAMGASDVTYMIRCVSRLQ